MHLYKHAIFQKCSGLGFTERLTIIVRYISKYRITKKLTLTVKSMYMTKKHYPDKNNYYFCELIFVRLSKK
jgi:hypothetical protein